MKKAISSIGITLLISISISAFAKDITNSSNELTPDNSTSADNLISFENLNADGAQQELSPPSISPSTSEVIELTGIPSPLIGI
ncbi:hypothetical protein [Saccharospirillum mangrovi]|uniref:hypothetical protein n=1 Tax=Saccharospirillum mangrovi TaxID=2161747 RepID=UPI0013007845|nr:hypothetical protein [Saccharospirillum mangrovi]